VQHGKTADSRVEDGHRQRSIDRRHRRQWWHGRRHRRGAARRGRRAAGRGRTGEPPRRGGTGGAGGLAAAAGRGRPAGPGAPALPGRAGEPGGHGRTGTAVVDVRCAAPLCAGVAKWPCAGSGDVEPVRGRRPRGAPYPRPSRPRAGGRTGAGPSTQLALDALALPLKRPPIGDAPQFWGLDQRQRPPCPSAAPARRDPRRAGERLHPSRRAPPRPGDVAPDVRMQPIGSVRSTSTVADEGRRLTTTRRGIVRIHFTGSGYPLWDSERGQGVALGVPVMGVRWWRLPRRR
jgi:hypothetical protein